MFVCMRDIYVSSIYVCVYVCIGLHTELNSLETQKANFPLHSCILMAFHIHCFATRMENSLHVTYTLEVNHCLTARDKTRMILSSRLEESLDSALCSSELRGTEEMSVARLLPSLKWMNHSCGSPLCNRFNLPLGRKKSIIFNCLQVFHCLSFISCEGIMCYFSPC